MRNHHVNTAVMSTLQAPLLPTMRLRYTSSNSNSGTTFFSTISCLFILIHLISLPHQRARNSIKHSICSPIRTYNISNRHVSTLHVFFFSMTLSSFPQLLSIIRPIHLQILTQAPLFSHFPSKNLNKYTSSPKIPSKCLHDLAKIIPLHHHAPPFIQHFLLIMCEIVMYALSFPQRISIIPLQILTQAPPISHFPSKNQNNYTSFLQYPRNAYMS